MPTFEEQSDDDNAICPYCKHSYQVEGEDYSEDEREVECEECGKTYLLHQSFSVTHETRPDCRLNGEDHKFTRRKLHNSNQMIDECEVCGRMVLAS